MLQIALFGVVRVTHNNWITEVQLTRENQALLAYLLLHRHRTHSREVLADIFWGEASQEKARGSLNTALWKIKKVLEPEGIPAGTYLKNTQAGGVAFNTDNQYWLDVEAFEGEVKRNLSLPFETAEASRLLDLEKALGLYKGDVLEGFYEDWVLRERERLRALYLDALIYLLHYYRSHRVNEKAIIYGQQILDLDPLREEIHQEMMSMYIENGQRALAIRQYESCRSILAKEIGIPPMEATEILYKQIFSNPDANASPLMAKKQISFEQALHHLMTTFIAMDIAKEQVQEILQLIAKYTEHLG